MKAPLFVRPVTDAERDVLTKGLRSPDASTLRRCQIVLASSRGERASGIAGGLGCSEQGVRNAIGAFNRAGLAALARRSSRPVTIRPAFDAAGAQGLRALLHRRPRDFGKGTSLWTLPLVAEVAASEGLTTGPITGETVRATLARLGVQWQRAKRWIVNPDPAYARKKSAATSRSASPPPAWSGRSASRTRLGGAASPPPPAAPGGVGSAPATGRGGGASGRSRPLGAGGLRAVPARCERGAAALRGRPSMPARFGNVKSVGQRVRL